MSDGLGSCTYFAVTRGCHIFVQQLWVNNCNVYEKQVTIAICMQLQWLMKILLLITFHAIYLRSTHFLQ